MTVIIESVGADPQNCHHPISFLLKTYFLFMVITPIEVFDHAEAFTLLSCLLFLKDFFFFGDNDNFPAPSDPFACCFRCFAEINLLFGDPSAYAEVASKDLKIGICVSGKDRKGSLDWSFCFVDSACHYPPNS